MKQMDKYILEIEWPTADRKEMKMTLIILNTA